MRRHLFAKVDPATHRALSGESRVRVLEVLRAADAPMTVPAVAGHVGLHPNTVRAHLDRLAGAGLVRQQADRRDGPGRPRLVYSAVATDRDREAADTGGEKSGRGYELLAEALAGHLAETAADPTAEAVATGRAWGRLLGAQRPPGTGPVPAPEVTLGLVRLLDRLGFAPRSGGDGTTLELHRCPFRQAAAHPSPVACGLHLGLMQGALAEQSAPVRVGRLEPFVTPQLCLAQLDVAARAPADGPAPAGHRPHDTARRTP